MTATTPFQGRAFLITALFTALWINVSEIFRYFVFVMPMMRASFPDVPGIAPINPLIFLSWMVWDTLLIGVVTSILWFGYHLFGRGLAAMVGLVTFAWTATFGIFWLAEFNLALATPNILALALPLSWFELLIGGLIVRWGQARFEILTLTL